MRSNVMKISAFTLSLFFILISGCLGDNEKKDHDKFIEIWDMRSEVGYVEEGNTVDVYDIIINETDYLTNLTVTVTWMDEPDYSNGFRSYRNTPDEFQIWIDNNHNIVQTNTGSNEPNQEGIVIVEYPFQYLDEPKQRGPLTITISVEIMYSGDFVPSPIGRQVDDPGNDFICTTEYSYLKNMTAEGS